MVKAFTLEWWIVYQNNERYKKYINFCISFFSNYFYYLFVVGILSFSVIHGLLIWYQVDSFPYSNLNLHHFLHYHLILFKHDWPQQCPHVLEHLNTFFCIHICFKPTQLIISFQFSLWQYFNSFFFVNILS